MVNEPAQQPLEKVEPAQPVVNTTVIKAEPFWQKTWRRITHPKQTIKKIIPKIIIMIKKIYWWFKKVVVWLYYRFVWLYCRLKDFGNRIFWFFKKLNFKVRHINRKFLYLTTGNQRAYQIEKLRFLKPSKLFLYVIYSKPINVSCDIQEKRCFIANNGNVLGCCLFYLPFGNLKTTDRSLSEIYNSLYARILRLSTLNNSYCLCDFFRCNVAKNIVTDDQQIQLKPLVTADYPIHFDLGFDQSCNLSCKSCRKCHYVVNEKEQKELAYITQKIIASGWLEKTKWLRIGGNGEVFYSPYYRQLLKNQFRRNQIGIVSNGILFNQKNWQLIENKYEYIECAISIDAATPETYQKIRGGNWQVLMKNLAMLSNLRQLNKINNFVWCFVVQKDNFYEMVDFVKFARDLHVDKVFFQKMNNWEFSGSASYYKKNSMIIKNKYLDHKLYQVIKDPIFNDPIVDLRDLQKYIDQSDIHYKNI